VGVDWHVAAFASRLSLANALQAGSGRVESRSGAVGSVSGRAIAVAHVGTRNTHSPAEGSFFPAVW
jgi:hypothetical protein